MSCLCLIKSSKSLHRYFIVFHCYIQRRPFWQLETVLHCLSAINIVYWLMDCVLETLNVDDDDDDIVFKFTVEICLVPRIIISFNFCNHNNFYPPQKLLCKFPWIYCIRPLVQLVINNEVHINDWNWSKFVNSNSPANWPRC